MHKLHLIKTSAQASLENVINKYKLVCNELELCAEAVPETPQDMKALIDKEAALLDEQASLLETALNLTPQNFEDARALLWIWHNEVIATQTQTSLSEADKIIKKVCNFLNV